MRYDDWDVLLFPSGRDDRVPLREFKVNCHVVPDADFSHSRATFGVPVMTCFVPGLQPGAPFHISIHSWCRPKPSQYTLNYTKHPDLATFEARIFIDGRMVASTLLQPFGAWPHLIASTCQMTKQGELEQLKFPSFRRELLFQNHWSPSDDLGRIKVLISEGFPRDSPSNPVERVKNVVAFAFQHAPLEILETNGIAWPNPQMWRRPQNNPALPVPTFYPDDGPDSHLHSPRRRPLAAGHNMPTISTALTAPPGSAATLDAVLPGRSRLQKASTSTASSFLDPFNESAYQAWIDSLGLDQQQHHVDTNAIWPTLVSRGNDNSGADPAMGGMQAYMPSAVRDTATADPMGLSGRSLDEDVQMEMLKVPNNTPTAFLGADHAAPGQFTCNIPNPSISSEFAHSLTHSLLNQPHPLPTLPQSVQPHQIQLPASEIKSRKENRHVAHAGSVGSSTNPSPSVEAQIRKFSASNTAFGIIGNDRTISSASGSGPTFSRHSSAGEFGRDITNTASPNQTYAGVAASGTGPGSGSGSEKGTKRSRNFTPASAKAIDEEDEPRRASPRLRVATTFPLNSEDNSSEK